MGGLRKLSSSVTKIIQTDLCTTIAWVSQSDWLSAEIRGVGNFEFFNTIAEQETVMLLRLNFRSWHAPALRIMANQHKYKFRCHRF